MTRTTLDKPPITHLSLQHLQLPIMVLVSAIILAGGLALQQGITEISYLQLLIGIVTIGLGFGWLAFSWKPGAGSQKDIIAPWLTVGALLFAAYIADDGVFSLTQSLIQTIALYALPFMAGLTLLTRLQAPTDLCSSSSAMGFCAGGYALTFMALTTPTVGLTTTLYTCAATIGIVMGVSRITLCHLIKW